MAARDRYGGWSEPPQSTLQRYIREYSALQRTI
jgi:hypothetical protein